MEQTSSNLLYKKQMHGDDDPHDAGGAQEVPRDAGQGVGGDVRDGHALPLDERRRLGGGLQGLCGEPLPPEDDHRVEDEERPERRADAGEDGARRRRAPPPGEAARGGVPEDDPPPRDAQPPREAAHGGRRAAARDRQVDGLQDRQALRRELPPARRVGMAAGAPRRRLADAQEPRAAGHHDQDVREDDTGARGDAGLQGAGRPAEGDPLRGAVRRDGVRRGDGRGRRQVREAEGRRRVARPHAEAGPVGRHRQTVPNHEGRLAAHEAAARGERADDPPRRVGRHRPEGEGPEDLRAGREDREAQGRDGGGEVARRADGRDAQEAGHALRAALGARAR